MFSYLIEILICQALFLGLYQFFKAEPFFRVNRMYLLGTLIISLILPLINFSQAIPYDISQTYVEWMQPLQIGGDTIENTTISKVENLENSSSFQWNTYAVIYGIGLFLYLLWFSLRNRTVFHYLSLNSFEDYKFKPLVIIPKSNMAFSFWNRIYLGSEIPESQYQVILEHEYQHLKQKHSWDMMFVEVLQFLMWFNPLIYIYKNQLRQIHEFEADQSVTRSHSKINYINTLLNQSFGSQSVTFTSTFFHKSNLKTRIRMLQKTRISNLKKAKYFLILPVLFLAFLFSCSQDDMSIQKSSNEDWNYRYERILQEHLELDKFFHESMPTLEQRISQKPSVADLLGSYGFEIKNKYNNDGRKISWIMMWLTSSDVYNNDFSYRKSVLKEIYASRDLWGMAQKKVEDYKSNGGFISHDVNGNIILDDNRISFAKVEIPPHPGTCIGLEIDDLKKCTTDFISNHVSQNFIISNFKNLQPKKYRISVQFAINSNGVISDVKANGPLPELEAGAIKAVQSLPDFVPGEVDGEPVTVLYGLPINFIIDK